MDQTLANTLTANLKHAQTDEERHNAFTLAMIAMVDCQCKTGSRVKRQRVILVGIGLLFLISLLCGDESALRVLCFWRTGAVQ